MPFQGRRLPGVRGQRCIARAFNDHLGNIDWKDADKIRQVIAKEILAKVAADKAYKSAQKHLVASKNAPADAGTASLQSRKAEVAPFARRYLG